MVLIHSQCRVGHHFRVYSCHRSCTWATAATRSVLTVPDSAGCVRPAGCRLEYRCLERGRGLASPRPIGCTLFSLGPQQRGVAGQCSSWVGGKAARGVLYRTRCGVLRRGLWGMPPLSILIHCIHILRHWAGYRVVAIGDVVVVQSREASRVLTRWPRSDPACVRLAMWLLNRCRAV